MLILLLLLLLLRHAHTDRLSANQYSMEQEYCSRRSVSDDALCVYVALEELLTSRPLLEASSHLHHRPQSKEPTSCL